MSRSIAGVNHLADETSPYLRQHADNPVEWTPGAPRPWTGPRRRTSRSSCPSGMRPATGAMSWPHESFEDPATAADLAKMVRIGQGRPGGATRPRCRLHVGDPGPDRLGRLAHVGLLHSRRPAVLRRNVLPARRRHGMPALPAVVQASVRHGGTIGPRCSQQATRWRRRAQGDAPGRVACKKKVPVRSCRCRELDPP